MSPHWLRKRDKAEREREQRHMDQVRKLERLIMALLGRKTLRGKNG